MLGGPSNARWCLSISGKGARVCLASFTSCPWPRCWGQSQVALFSARWPFYGATSLRRPSEPFCRPRVIKMKGPERQKSKKKKIQVILQEAFDLYFTENLRRVLKRICVQSIPVCSDFTENDSISVRRMASLHGYQSPMH